MDVGLAGACIGLIETCGISPLQAQNTDWPRDTSALKSGWLSPAKTYRPHTRWWVPGGIFTRDGITWQMEQMRTQGMGGVEVMIPWVMYAKGNIEFLSDEWLEMVKFAVQEGARLDLEVAFTFSPGWCFGGFWVSPAERSKMLTRAFVDVNGPGTFNQELPAWSPEGPPRAFGGLPREFHSDAPDENLILAVVAGQIAGQGLKADTLIDLTSRVNQNRLDWEIPSGQWRVMVFRLKYTGQRNSTTENFVRQQWVVDHFSKKAVQNYCDYMGGALYRAFGEQFGSTVDSMFCDSFEISCLDNTLLWSNDTLQRFQAYKGYDLTPYLPALWWDIGELTPKIRYDVGDFLSWLGLDTLFDTFVDWCEQHHTQARIQPYYRFTEELMQGAGRTSRPEMEVSTMWFGVIGDPRKAVAAGAHLYGREIVSCEAYTFLHPTIRYETTLEQMKLATDAFIRDGVTQFYNHGYLYSPEMHVAPQRDVPFANRISHWNTWWKYYHHLTAYISRCCYLMRQGSFAGDVLVYTPQATVWSERTIFVNERRVMNYGDLPKTLVANGYDFDIVNDDVLQNHARVENGQIKVRDLSYRFLILPKATAMPLATLEFIHKFAMSGGVVIALDELPAESTGLDDYRAKDQQLKQRVRALFGPEGKGQALAGGGHTYYLPDYKMDAPPLAPGNQPPYKPTPPLQGVRADLIKALRSYLAPDFALANNQQSNGLTFLHRRLGDTDIYFVTNLQPSGSRMFVTFRVTGRTPEEWNPYTGQISPLFVHRPHPTGIEVLIDLAPYASTCVVFAVGSSPVHLTDTSLEKVTEATEHEVRGIAARNGPAQVTVIDNGNKRTAQATVSGLPEPLALNGTWKISLEGYRFPKFEADVSQLASWTDDPRTRHFSGTGRYELDFNLSADYVYPDTLLTLDLGSVGQVAEVHLNGRNAGVAWMQPYRLDITEAARAGPNHLEVTVTNVLINYVSGLDKLPEVPEELTPHYGPTIDIYQDGAKAWESHEKDLKDLPASGLMGPVKIEARRKVTVTV